MNIEITARHFPLTGAIASYAHRHLAGLDQFEGRIEKLHLVLDHDGVSPQYHLKAHLSVPGNDLHAEVNSDDLYEGIDLLAGKLTTLLRKRHDIRHQARHSAKPQASAA